MKKIRCVLFSLLLCLTFGNIATAETFDPTNGPPLNWQLAGKTDYQKVGRLLGVSPADLKEFAQKANRRDFVRLGWLDPNSDMTFSSLVVDKYRVLTEARPTGKLEPAGIIQLKNGQEYWIVVETGYVGKSPVQKETLIAKSAGYSGQTVSATEPGSLKISPLDSVAHTTFPEPEKRVQPNTEPRSYPTKISTEGMIDSFVGANFYTEFPDAETKHRGYNVYGKLRIRPLLVDGNRLGVFVSGAANEGRLHGKSAKGKSWTSRYRSQEFGGGLTAQIKSADRTKELVADIGASKTWDRNNGNYGSFIASLWYGNEARRAEGEEWFPDYGLWTGLKLPFQRDKQELGWLSATAVVSVYDYINGPWRITPQIKFGPEFNFNGKTAFSAGPAIEVAAYGHELGYIGTNFKVGLSGGYLSRIYPVTVGVRPDGIWKAVDAYCIERANEEDLFIASPQNAKAPATSPTTFAKAETSQQGKTSNQVATITDELGYPDPNLTRN